MANIEQKKRLLFLITQSELGGAQKYVFDLAFSLRDEYEIAVGFGEQGGDGELARQLKAIYVKCFEINSLKRDISPIKDFKAIFEIRKIIKGWKPDIIHLNSSKISIIGSMATIFLKCKVIYTAHGWVFNEPMNGLKRSLYEKLERWTAKIKDAIICVSENDVRTAIDAKIASPGKLHMIHNGITDSPLLDAASAKAKLGFGPEEFVIGSIGNLYATKGFEHFIEAMKILVDSGFNFKAIIIGEGQERAKLEDLISQYNLRQRVFLLGRIDQARQLLPAFDIYVCSSVKEGLSYTIIEAMLAQRPIIATSVGGNPEMIIEGETGLLAGPANAMSLAGRIHELLDDPARTASLGQAARQKALAEFSLDKMVEQTKEVYSE